MEIHLFACFCLIHGRKIQTKLCPHFPPLYPLPQHKHKLTHESEPNFEVDKGNVKHQSTNDEEGGIQELYLWVLYDGSDDKIDGGQQNKDGNHDRNLCDKTVGTLQVGCTTKIQ